MWPTWCKGEDRAYLQEWFLLHCYTLCWYWVCLYDWGLPLICQGKWLVTQKLSGKVHQIQKQYKSKTHSSNSTYSSSGTQFSMPVYIMYTTTASNGKIKKIKGKLKASYYKPVHKREVSGSRPWRKVLVFFFFFFFFTFIDFFGQKIYFTYQIKCDESTLFDGVDT